ncbi:MAG: hypothetical protein ACI8W8_001974, partial [Rhodothermales bacterium]
MIFRIILIGFCLAISASAAVINNDNGSVFDPNDASVVNGATTWAVNVTIDTDAKTIDSGGGPIAVPSDDAVSEGGDVTLTMFTFSSLTVNAVTVTVTGSRGLVLATAGALTMNGIIKAAGVNGLDPPGNNVLATGGAGGPGGGAGGDSGASTVAGPGTDGTAPTNNGGLPATVVGQAAGAGEEGGGGGAHAGGGGFGSRAAAAGGQTVNGGFAYGDGALNELYGGSGGGGGHRTNGGGSVELGGAGGGGGAIELLARGTLTVNGIIDVSGGDGGLLNSPNFSGNDYGGGGGGGGGVILAGINMVIGATAVVDASGGDGSQKPVAGGNTGGHRPAGGGGGGRIAIYSDALADAGGTYNTAGGAESNWEPAGSQTDGGVGSLAIVNTIDLDAPPALTANSGSVMDPNDGMSNGAATWSAAVAIDTDAKSVTVGGVPLFLPFQDVTSEGGDVTLAAITFSDLTIDPGVTVTVTGSQGLILAATNNLTVNGDIVATGSIGSTATNAVASGGASGGGGGTGGDSGGTAFGVNAEAGSAPANNGALPASVGGPSGTVGSEQGGAGGGFGGIGGVGSTAGSSPTASSVGYGTAALTELYGGSGGGGGHRSANGSSWETGGGGGGGGALELVARGTLTLNGSIDASGGPGGQVDPDGGNGNDYGGGGGGGGGVILAGINVVLGAASSVSATGGDGSQDPVAPNTVGGNQRPAGGGGGGRVAVLAQNYTDNGVTIDLSGGARTDWQSTSAQTNGGAGTFAEIRTVGLGVAPTINAVAGSIMDPNLAFSNGDATWSTAVTINTTTQEVTVGGVPAFLAFQPINSVGGDAKLLALNFDNLTIDPAVVVTVTGEF